MKAEWQDIHVGDFIHLSCNEIIPADVVLVKSSDHQGICHIETCNLDGETNLKQRQAVFGISYGVSVNINQLIPGADPGLSGGYQFRGSRDGSLLVRVQGCKPVFDLLLLDHG